MAETRSQGEDKAEGPPREEGALVADDYESEGDELTLEQDPPEFYDELTDEKDEKWAQKQRRGRSSDAILSCPACFTTLCLDCQRHDRYPNQFRAMFVRNCKVSQNEVLRSAPARRRGGGGRRGKGKAPGDGEEGGGGAGEFFKPVCCAECGTEVAVLDSEEVYHFYDAIPSYC